MSNSPHDSSFAASEPQHDASSPSRHDSSILSQDVPPPGVNDSFESEASSEKHPKGKRKRTAYVTFISFLGICLAQLHLCTCLTETNTSAVLKCQGQDDPRRRLQDEPQARQASASRHCEPRFPQRKRSSSTKPIYIITGATRNTRVVFPPHGTVADLLFCRFGSRTAVKTTDESRVLFRPKNLPLSESMACTVSLLTPWLLLTAFTTRICLSRWPPKHRQTPQLSHHHRPMLSLLHLWLPW